MKLEVLVSTMNNNRLLIEEMNIQSEAVIINQTDSDETSIIKTNYGDIRWIDVNDKGLSKSRNLAIKNAEADIILLADDDLEYIDGYPKIVKEAFRDNPDFDAICFQVIGKNEKFKDYKNKSKKINYLRSMKISSVEIAFRRKSLIDNNISFNEHFGSGSTYYMGEENILLFESLRKGLRIKYIPKQISYLYIGKSTWFEGYTEEYFIATGAKFTEMSKHFSYLLILQFAVRKYSMYKSSSSFFNALKNMLRGRKEVYMHYKIQNRNLYLD